MKQFSLLEILIAMGVMAIGFACMVPLFLYAAKATNSAVRITKATSVAQYQLKAYEIGDGPKEGEHDNFHYFISHPHPVSAQIKVYSNGDLVHSNTIRINVDE